MPNWHRVSDADIDKELDFLLSKELLQQQTHPVEPTFYPGYHPISFGARPAIMPDGDSFRNTATAAVGFREETEENLKPNNSPSTDSPLSYHSNEFDNPEYHKSDEHDNHIRVCEESLPESSAETKQEGAPTAVMTTSASADLQMTHPGINGFYSSYPLQRVLSEPINHSTTNWQSDDSDGAPVSHSTHHPTSGIHHSASHATWKRVQALKTNFDPRARTQTYPSGPTSHPRQNGASSNPSALSNVKAWDHIEPASMRFGPYGNPGSLSNSLAHNVGGQYYNYVAEYDVDTHHPVLGLNQAGGLVNSQRVNKDSFQHNNNDGTLSTNSYVDLRKVQQRDILKSQPLPTSSNIRNNANLARSQTGGSMRAHSHQDHMEGRKERSTSPRPDLVYNDIESARQAERPKFKTNPRKDITIPLTDAEKQEYVRRMTRCMKGTKFAQDNAGMINQWEKLSQDEPRIEQAAWRLLDMCLQTQKTMCKHLLGSEFAAQLVNDPTTATQRVQNNRKVNAGKKSYLDKGRRAVHGGAARSARRGSSASTRLRAEDTDDDGHPYGDVHDGSGIPSLLGEMGDEDAEGETEEEYLNPTGNARVDHVPAAGAEPTPARRPKRELDHDDSDEYGSRAKKSRRTSTKTYPTAAKRHIKNPRRPGDRSKFQIVNGKMIELEDKKNEDLVFSHGSAHIQELYNKIHYPQGRPSSRNGRYVNGHASSTSGYYPGAQASSASSSRRHPREAACKSFVGQDDTSTEGDDPFSDPKNEEADQYHQDEGPQQPPNN
ncbi:MAG: hypothetical protein L6R42_002176 [Xanthoria sp. 1 TBL-2021]|nr:MAG: hypothetical protein L6R42_002176 [Xanthoria sp. 1 TBL-2021]